MFEKSWFLMSTYTCTPMLAYIYTENIFLKYYGDRLKVCWFLYFELLV